MKKAKKEVFNNARYKKIFSEYLDAIKIVGNRMIDTDRNESEPAMLLTKSMLFLEKEFEKEVELNNETDT